MADLFALHAIFSWCIQQRSSSVCQENMPKICATRIEQIEILCLCFIGFLDKTKGFWTLQGVKWDFPRSKV